MRSGLVRKGYPGAQARILAATFALGPRYVALLCMGAQAAGASA